MFRIISENTFYLYIAHLRCVIYTVSIESVTKLFCVWWSVGGARTSSRAVREAMRFIRTRAHPCSGERSGSDRWRGYLLPLPNQCDSFRLFGRGVPLSSRLSSPCLRLTAIFLRIQRIMEALATRCALFLAQIALFSNTGMQSRNLYITLSVFNKSFIIGLINECGVCNAV